MIQAEWGNGLPLLAIRSIVRHKSSSALILLHRKDKICPSQWV